MLHKNLRGSYSISMLWFQEVFCRSKKRIIGNTRKRRFVVVVFTATKLGTINNNLLLYPKILAAATIPPVGAGNLFNDEELNLNGVAAAKHFVYATKHLVVTKCCPISNE